MDRNVQDYWRRSGHRLIRMSSEGNRSRSRNVAGDSFHQVPVCRSTTHRSPIRQSSQNLGPRNRAQSSQPNQHQLATQVEKSEMNLFLEEVVRKSKQMKATPDTVTFVCESFQIPKVNLKDASKRPVDPAPEPPIEGWPLIHTEIRSLRID